MSDNENNTLNKALLSILTPLARLCLRYGRGYREFQDLAKAAFVKVASEDYGVHGRPTNASRIAAMTGLTRKETSQIRRKIEEDKAAITQYSTPVKNVIAAWQTNKEFLDKDAMPAVLPVQGERGSLSALIKQHAGDIPEGAMRKELERVGALEAVNGEARLRSTTLVDPEDEEEAATKLLSGPYPLLAVLAHNDLVVRAGKRWPIETISQRSVPKSELAHVRELVSVRMLAATKTIADLLDAYSTVHDDIGEDKTMVPVSVGIYYAEGLKKS